MLFSKQRRPIAIPPFFPLDMSPNTKVSAWWASAEHEENYTWCYLYIRGSWALSSFESHVEIHFKHKKNTSSIHIDQH